MKNFSSDGRQSVVEYAFLTFPSGFSPENLSDVSNEHGEQ